MEDDLVKKAKDFVDSNVLEKQSVSVTDNRTALQISPITAWKILRKRLGWYIYKPRSVVCHHYFIYFLLLMIMVMLRVRQICDRARACITKTGGQFERVLNTNRLRVNWDGDKRNVFMKCPNLIMKNIYLYLNKYVVPSPRV